jgi:AcrR family transcriptional regulator
VTADSSIAVRRKPRADAERNRQKLLDSARAAFEASGTSVSLEDVAKSAGVGIGTLYRHFPTRGALVAEVYRNEAGKLAAAARQLKESVPPLEALRQWLHLFVDYLATKLILVDALQSMVGDTSQLTEASKQQLGSALGMLLESAADSGVIGADHADPTDLLWAIGGVAMSRGPDWPAAARRMADILIAGMTKR